MMFGYRRGELIGDTLELLLPERVREAHVAYGIVHDHGGTITADSAPGEATRFLIRLPVVPSQN